jgi:hypothetical protein
MFLYRADKFIFHHSWAESVTIRHNRQEFIDRPCRMLDKVASPISLSDAICNQRGSCTFTTSGQSRILGIGGPGKCFFFFQPGLLYFLILLILSVVGCWLSGAGVDCRF